jgi:multidrug transporter EmrE-like cation transporter
LHPDPSAIESQSTAIDTEYSAIKALADKSVLLVFCCTFLGAAAQIFFKLGANSLGSRTLTQVLANPIPVILNPFLLAAYSLYGINTALLTLALRKGQLSLLYPVISLTYVWVTLLSMLIFNEQMNVLKAVGLGIVVAGVAVLGRNGDS